MVVFEFLCNFATCSFPMYGYDPKIWASLRATIPVVAAMDYGSYCALTGSLRGRYEQVLSFRLVFAGCGIGFAKQLHHTLL